MKLLTNNLSKTYRNGVKALDRINHEIGTGMFGLLGPNGAGNKLHKIFNRSLLIVQYTNFLILEDYTMQLAGVDDEPCDILCF